VGCGCVIQHLLESLILRLFCKTAGLFPPLAAPFAVPNSTEFKALTPSPNVEPLIVPNPPGTESATTTTKTVIIDNARAYNPTVIYQQGKMSHI